MPGTFDHSIKVKAIFGKTHVIKWSYFKYICKTHNYLLYTVFAYTHVYVCTPMHRYVHIDIDMYVYTFPSPILQKSGLKYVEVTNAIVIFKHTNLYFYYILKYFILEFLTM